MTPQRAIWNNPKFQHPEFSGQLFTLVRISIMDFIIENRHMMKGKILDLGSGDWLFCKYLLDGEDYTRADFYRTETVDIVTNIMDMKEIENQTYDTIICTDVLEHICNPFKAFDELSRIIKKNGMLFLTTPFNFWLHGEPFERGLDYWRLTDQSLKYLLRNWESAEITFAGQEREPLNWLVVARK
jgi:SAM-dependent methyltransferase